MITFWKLLWRVTNNWAFGKYGSLARVYALEHLMKTSLHNVHLGRGITIVAFEKLTIGNNVSIHDNCYIDAKGGVKIGDDCSIAREVSILSFNHKFTRNDVPIREQGLALSPIVISNNVWIGCKCVILAGATINEHSVVGAMSLCNKQYPMDSIIAGIPAKVIRTI